MPGYNHVQERVIRYTARISRSGKRLYVAIPKRLHQELKPGQEVIVYLQPL